MTNLEKIKGGIVPAYNVSKEPPFSLLMTMINNPTCKISSISYSSLFGFIFKLEIDPPPKDLGFSRLHMTPFKKLNKEKTAYNEPAYSIVLKLALLGGTRCDLPVYKNVEKACDNEDSFKEESKNQSHIYLNTYNNGEPICPSIVSSVILRDIDLIKEFLNKMKNKSTNDKEATSMLDYMIKSVTYINTKSLGIIAMESATEYVTIYKYKRGLSYFSRDKNTYNLYCKLIFLVLRLYYETGIIHCDLHLNNAMINSENKDVKLIDFGRISGRIYSNNKINYSSITKHEISESMDYIINSERDYNKKHFNDYFSNIRNYYLYCINNQDVSPSFLETLVKMFKEFSKKNKVEHITDYKPIETDYPETLLTTQEKEEQQDQNEEQKDQKEKQQDQKEKQQEEQIEMQSTRNMIFETNKQHGGSKKTRKYRKKRRKQTVTMSKKFKSK
jgi:hypothetical protein